MSRRHSKGKKKREPGGFLALPMAVLNSPAYVGLSSKGVKLLLDLASQYRGDNNGDLTAAWKVMRKRGWRSEETLNKAKREILRMGFLAEMRKGHCPNVCSLYALTWFDLDPNPKHDVERRAFPYGAWKHCISTDWGRGPMPEHAAKNAALNTKGAVSGKAIATKTLADDLQMLRAA